MELNNLTRPALLLDESKCRANIRLMAEKARSSGVKFRPHFKTHQSTEIGQWFREEGVDKITVSSLTMARHFAESGWTDITVAFPFNLREIEDFEKLSSRITLNILISDIQQAEFLTRRPGLKAGYFIKVDTGYNRSGIKWDNHDDIKRIYQTMSTNTSVRMEGFLTHAGHTYKATSSGEVINIYDDTLLKCTSLRSLFSEPVILSAGDTPSSSLVQDFIGWDEIRPGNFVFYDLTQYFIGSCRLDQVAVTVACPVVEKNHKRHEFIIYGGGVHLSKESYTARDGRVIYGKAVLYNRNGWFPVSDGDYLRSISQEHGIISASEELFSRLEVGDLVGIIPVHSCMTADLHKQYQTLDGKIISGFSPK
jgi:D-serine deaminase-like pyridoxal phosphate-dependent protein